MHVRKYFLSLYMSKGIVIPGTIIERLVTYGLSPTRCAFNKHVSDKYQEQCGEIDSLRLLITHENFVKAYSEEHVLACMLLKSF